MRTPFVFFLSLIFTTSINAKVEQDLCSTDGLMRLIPQLKNAQGKFEIPNPKKELHKFLIVHQTLTNVIEMALTQSYLQGDPYQLAHSQQVSLNFSPSWRSAEIGVMTDGKMTSFPDGDSFASYGGESFMNGVTPVDGTSKVFYKVAKPDGTIPALVYAQPTTLACVNRLVLAGANTAGTWIPPSYVLGTKEGKAYLIVDKCVDLGLVSSANGVKRLMPNGEVFVAIQWADTATLAHMRTNDKAHTH